MNLENLVVFFQRIQTNENLKKSKRFILEKQFIRTKTYNMFDLISFFL